MGYMENYEEWLANPYFDEDTKKELESIRGDENEIKERFYADLEFGTAGLRGIIGAGTNRMNVYTVRKATQGLANYILSQKGEKKESQLHSIVVECRRNLPMKLPAVWLQTASKPMYLRAFVRRRNFRLPSENLAAFPESM